MKRYDILSTGTLKVVFKSVCSSEIVEAYFIKGVERTWSGTQISYITSGVCECQATIRMLSENSYQACEWKLIS